MREMLKVIPGVIPKGSLLIFDSGANTKGNKEKIRESGFHYLNVGRQRRLKPIGNMWSISRITSRMLISLR